MKRTRKSVLTSSVVSFGKRFRQGVQQAGEAALQVSPSLYQQTGAQQQEPDPIAPLCKQGGTIVDLKDLPATSRHPSGLSSGTEICMDVDSCGMLVHLPADRGPPFGEEAQRPLPLPAPAPTPAELSQYAGADVLLNGRYRVLRDLARGESGWVQHAVDVHTGQDVAIKLIDRTRKLFDPKVVGRELQNQHLCAAHPNIVQLREVFLLPSHLAIVMEYCDGSDLAHYVDALMQHTGHGIPEAQARVLFQQLMVAVEFCHRLGIANRDIKLDNMMLHGGCGLKMCDFGFSKDMVGQSTCKSSCGTPEYIAPELLFQGKYDGKIADTWSCGVSLYVLLVGRFPFSWPEDADPATSNVRRMQKMFARITAGHYMPLPSEISPECQHLLARMLQPDASKRASATEVMRHPWFAAGLPPQLASLNDALLHAAAAGGLQACRQSSAELARLVANCKVVKQDGVPLPFRQTTAFIPAHLQSSSHAAAAQNPPISIAQLATYQQQQYQLHHHPQPHMQQPHTQSQ